jgi:hypothetical protein
MRFFRPKKNLKKGTKMRAFFWTGAYKTAYFIGKIGCFIVKK